MREIKRVLGLINKDIDRARKADISAEEVRSMERYRNSSEEEVKQIINTLIHYTRIIFRIFNKGHNLAFDLYQK